MRVPITTSIDSEQYKVIKKNGWKVSELVDLGIGSKLSPDVAREKMHEYEYAQKNLLATIKSLRDRIVKLEDDKMGLQDANTTQ